MIEGIPSTTYGNLSPAAPEKAPLEPPARRKTGPVERRQRLSRSKIWTLERRFYEQQGAEAWTRTGIPFLITSNPFIAEAYARIVLGFVRDCGAPASGPLTIVEIGAGHGRFSYLFLKKLLRLRERAGLGHVPFRYVMTDFAEPNIESWRARPELRPFVEAGVLDFARYDAGRSDELRLLGSGEVITAESPCGPLAVIANYVFDSLPQDCFRVSGGRLDEVLLTLGLQPGDTDLTDPSALARAVVSYEHAPAADDYYDDPDWNAVLAGYRARLSACAFHFPVTALACLRDLHRLSRGGFLLLSGDKGYSDEVALLHGFGEPILASHAEGCFSMMVNYHAIGEVVARQGGVALHPGHAPESLNVSAFVIGSPHTEVRQAYDDAIEAFGPDDLFTVSDALEARLEGMSLAQLLAYLRLTRYASRAFLLCAPLLTACAAQASELQKRAIARALDEVWEAYTPLGEGPEIDVAFQLAGVWYTMQYLPEAIASFQSSIDLCGAEPGTLHNLGLCHYHLRSLDEAMACFQGALELDPNYEPAREMLLKAQADARLRR